MTQLSSTACAYAAQWKMWLLKVFSVTFFTAVCTAQNATDVFATDVTPTSSMLESTMTQTVYEPPVPSLQLNSAWLEVFPSEKVELNCTISGTDWTINWYGNGIKILEQDSNLSLSSERSVLTITAGPQYSGKYSCEGYDKTRDVTTKKSNSLDVIVHENTKSTLSKKPDLDKMFPGESVTFTCTISLSSEWEYLWYHNESEIQASTNTYTIDSLSHSNSGLYKCKARRGKEPFYTKEGVISLQISDPPTPTLKLESRWFDVFEKETVKFSCEADSSDWRIVWYKNKKELQEGVNGDGSSLMISSVSKTNQGSYACKAQHKSRKVTSGFSKIANITVYDNLPEPTLTRSNGFDFMYVGEIVTFICTVDVSSDWSYQWYKDEELLSYTNQTINITLQIHNAGNYSCEAKRSEQTLTKLSEDITQNVLEIPHPSLRPITQWLDVFPSESVKMSCGMEGSSNWTYKWYKNEKVIQIVSTATLFIRSASAEDAGEYKCKGQLEDRSVSSSYSSGLTLTVYDKTPTVTLTQDPEYKVMFLGESVTFNCHINVSSGWKYEWYRGGNNLREFSSNYLISSVGMTDRGAYKCRAQRGENQPFSQDSQNIDLNVEEKKPKPLMTRQPDIDKLYAGESVSLECKVEISSGWEYHWFKDGNSISNNSRHFDIRNATVTESGTYMCMATRNKTEYKTEQSVIQVIISEIPVPTLKQDHWLDVFPSESVKLDCRMNASSDWTYSWYKDGQKIQAGAPVLFEFYKNTLSIASASSSHRGNYSCTGKLNSRSVSSNFSSQLTLKVYERPQAGITLLTGWSEVFSTDTLVLQCDVQESSYTWNYTWFKEGERISLPHSQKHIVTPQDDPEQSLYTCQGTRTGRPSYSRPSEAYRTKNLLLKRRVLLSISGCIFFGIIAVFLGCILLRVTRKPAAVVDRPDESNLFLTMAELKNRGDAPCPLVDYITDEELNAPPKEEENDTVCSETTPLPITTQEDQAVTTENHDKQENGGLVSFKQ